MGKLGKLVALAAISYQVSAMAVPVLELECRIDNSLSSSVARTIQLKDGNIVDVDCQNHPTCKKSIYKISMNYNSLYEYVVVTVEDTETKKGLSGTFILPPNSSGDSLKNALLDFGYGDLVQSGDELDQKDKKGRFLRISCERVN